MWCFVGALVTLPFYFVRELIAAFALFAIGFVAFAFAIVSLYMLQKGWEVAVTRIVDSEHLAERASKPEGRGGGCHEKARGNAAQHRGRVDVLHSGRTEARDFGEFLSRAADRW